ncbi:MAG: RNA 2'-phosphotransferase [Erythrobacter sp.]
MDRELPELQGFATVWIMPNPLKSRSKALSYWLRHAPEKGGVVLDANGWAAVDVVLSALVQRKLPTDAAMLNRVVNENDKQRFEFSDDGTQIRARQGHSVAVQGRWEPATPPDELFHGTVAAFLESIERDGLSKQKRHYVHLSPDLETAKKVGQRRGQPIILIIDAKSMHEDGVEFFLSSNGVWLVDAMPATRIKRMAPDHT